MPKRKKTALSARKGIKYKRPSQLTAAERRRQEQEQLQAQPSPAPSSSTGESRQPQEPQEPHEQTVSPDVSLVSRPVTPVVTPPRRQPPSEDLPGPSSCAFVVPPPPPARPLRRRVSGYSSPRSSDSSSEDEWLPVKDRSRSATPRRQNVDSSSLPRRSSSRLSVASARSSISSVRQSPRLSARRRSSSDLSDISSAATSAATSPSSFQSRSVSRAASFATTSPPRSALSTPKPIRPRPLVSRNLAKEFDAIESSPPPTPPQAVVVVPQPTADQHHPHEPEVSSSSSSSSSSSVNADFEQHSSSEDWPECTCSRYPSPDLCDPFATRKPHYRDDMIALPVFRPPPNSRQVPDSSSDDDEPVHQFLVRPLIHRHANGDWPLGPGCPRHPRRPSHRTMISSPVRQSASTAVTRCGSPSDPSDSSSSSSSPVGRRSASPAPRTDRPVRGSSASDDRDSFIAEVLSPISVEEHTPLASQNSALFDDEPWTDEVVMEIDRVTADIQRRDQIAAEHLELRREQRQQLPQTHLIAQNRFRAGTYSLGQMNEICPHCRAKHFRSEQTTRGQFTVCCMNGTVMLPDLQAFPQELLDLLTDRNNVHHVQFMDHIRHYNSACAFASVGADVVQAPGRGSYCFKVHGQIRHNLGHINRTIETPRYAELYFIETANDAVRHQQEINAELDGQVLLLLADLLRRVNPFAAGYRSLREVYETEAADALREGRIVPNIRLEFQERRSDDGRRYNRPTATAEVAAVFRSTDGEPPFERSIHVYCREGPSRFTVLQHVSPNCDPMCYPLIFPRGDAGYEPSLRRQGARARTNISMLEFMVFRLQVRPLEFNPILNAGKLTQQFIVDAFLKVEGERLHFLRNEQRRLRADLFRGLMDYVQQEGRGVNDDVVDVDDAQNDGNVDVNAINNVHDDQFGPGRLVILPSSFIGSPRSYVQNYLDAMAMVALCGKPDFFVTFTCNPKWPEITGNLEPWQKTEHRPDLVARVFHAKLKELIKDLTQNHVLGEMAGFVYVIEFQKRGLPHAHILIVMREEDRVRDSRQIDRMVSAEFPDPHQDRELYDAVVRHMIHGPCGAGIPSPCMTDAGTCGKNFPKAFCEQTVFSVNGYPLYRRRDDGVTHEVRGHEVNNGSVVPYNRYLLMKYDSHLNVEVCSSIKSVKYLFKYIYKGHDRARLRVDPANPVAAPAATANPPPAPAQPPPVPAVQPRDPAPPAPGAAAGPVAADVNVRRNVNAVDEIRRFIDGRYVSAPEASWRLFKNEMHDRSHTIVRLACHLPNEQMVYFHEGEENQAVQRHVDRPTTLTAWFALNERSVAARQYTYTQIPRHYVFHQERGALQYTWQERQFGHDKVIARMYSASPREGERFYLRILLLHVAGALSFEGLRTVNGVVHQTFQAAARALHLLLDNQEWVRCMQEAADVRLPRQLRQLFATILAFCDVGDAADLWERFKDDMSEDYRRRYDRDGALDRALFDIQRTLTLHGLRLVTFGLPDTRVEAPPIDVEIVDVQAEQNLADEHIATLNAQQEVVMAAVIAAVDDPTAVDRYFFVDGPGGSGKTYLYNTLIEYARGREIGVLAVAFTGIASILLKGGRTVHSQFKLPVPLYADSTSQLPRNGREAATIRACSVIIWDEIAMCPRHMLDVVDRTLRDLTAIDRPFGGKVVVLGGDFRQCAPVVINGGPVDIVEASVKNSDLWAHFRTIPLIDNVRADRGNADFPRWLLALGNGTLGTETTPGERTVIVPARCVTDSLITQVFGHRVDINNRDVLANRVILCPLNEQVFKLNDQILNRVDGTEKLYLATTSMIALEQGEGVGDGADGPFDAYPPEFVNSQTPTGMPPHRLVLKRGVVISLLRNLNARRGLCNGTRLVVTRLGDNVIGAEILNGPWQRSAVLIPRLDLVSTDTKLPFILKRRQFPVRVSFATTINKSQGQTFDKVGLQLMRPVFGHGQLYVAFSRVRSVQDIKVQVAECPGLQGKLNDNSQVVYTRNVVYPELLN